MKDPITVGGKTWTKEALDRHVRKLRKKAARHRVRMDTDPEYAAKIAAYMKAYREAHREEMREYNREWMRRWRAQRREAPDA